MLANYKTPPLDEVVLGVQFSAPPAYNSTHLAEVYGLFAGDFPKIEEQLRLEPQFETFGGNSNQGVQMHFGPPPVRNRSIFASIDENTLLQFQDDRLLLNWRQGINGAQYPHYSKVSEAFLASLTILADYYKRRFYFDLEINQVEVAYINIIKVDSFSDIGDYFSFLRPRPMDLEGVSFNGSEVVKLDDRPVARLHHEVSSAYSIDGRQKAIRYALTLRGKPAKEDLQSAKYFLDMGHEIIVNRFSALSTKLAHERWGKE